MFDFFCNEWSLAWFLNQSWKIVRFAPEESYNLHYYKKSTQAKASSWEQILQKI